MHVAQHRNTWSLHLRIALKQRTCLSLILKQTNLRLAHKHPVSATNGTRVPHKVSTSYKDKIVSCRFLPPSYSEAKRGTNQTLHHFIGSRLQVRIMRAPKGPTGNPPPHPPPPNSEDAAETVAWCREECGKTVCFWNSNRDHKLMLKVVLFHFSPSFYFLPGGDAMFLTRICLGGRSPN